jgi:hypothetical protein
MLTFRFAHLLTGGAILAVSIATGSISPPALADVMYTLDTFTGTGTPPAGP